MKRAFICLILIGIFLGYLRQNGRLTGIGVIDSAMAVMDTSLREYVQIVEGYISGEETSAGPSVADMLGAAVDVVPNSGADSEPDEDEAGPN